MIKYLVDSNGVQYSLRETQVVVPLQPGIYKRLAFDYEIGDWWNQKQNDGYDYIDKNRFAKTNGSNPATVATFYKEDRVSLNVAWQWFAFRQMIYACFGHFDEQKIKTEQPDIYDKLVASWASVMHGGRVITNNQGWNDGRRDDIQGLNLDAKFMGYMCLGMEGNVIKLTSDAIYNKGGDYNQCYKFETLDGSKLPPNPEEVNFMSHPHLFSIATIIGYVKNNDEWNKLESQIQNRWQHVFQFPQFEWANSHTILLNISNYGHNYVPVQRCKDWVAEQGRPNPFNPPIYTIHEPEYSPPVDVLSIIFGKINDLWVLFVAWLQRILTGSDGN